MFVGMKAWSQGWGYYLGGCYRRHGRSKSWNSGCGGGVREEGVINLPPEAVECCGHVTDPGHWGDGLADVVSQIWETQSLQWGAVNLVCGHFLREEGFLSQVLGLSYPRALQLCSTTCWCCFELTTCLECFRAATL